MAILRSQTKFNLSLVTFTAKIAPPLSCADVQEEATAGSEKPRRKACSTGRASGRSGAWGNPNKRAGNPKRIFQLIACLRYKSILRLILALSKNAKAEKAALLSQNSLYSSILIAPSIAASMMGRYLSKH